MRRLFSSGLLLILLLGLTTAVAFAQDPVEGKRIWDEEALCKNCHGAEGEGMWGAPLAGRQSTAQEWITQVRTPRRSMPSFSEAQISDQAITDIHAYLTSLPEPADFTPAAAELPADAHPGQTLIVEKRCVACHTETGPIRGFVARGEAPTVEFVLNQVRNPRENMPSFSEGQVSDEEVAQIVEFLNVEFAEQTSAEAAPAESAPAQQEAAPAQEGPATLPTSGGDVSTSLPVLLLTLGAGLLIVGAMAYRWAAHRR
jgi:mono/diheme cytochrome c family protein